LTEYWNQPKIARTYLYELLDEGTDYSNSEFAFGLVHADRVTVKPAFTGMANLISILQDPGSSFTPTSLEYTLTGAPSTVHRSLLQKRNGDYYVLLWNEVSVWSGTTGDISNNPVPITLIVPVASAVLQPTPLPRMAQRLPQPQPSMEEIRSLSVFPTPC